MSPHLLSDLVYTGHIGFVHCPCSAIPVPNASQPSPGIDPGIDNEGYPGRYGAWTMITDSDKPDATLPADVAASA